jgi:hypothetical protein
MAYTGVFEYNADCDRWLLYRYTYICTVSLRQVLLAVAPVCLERIDYTAVEALDHSIDAQRSGLGQTVLDTQFLAQSVKLMIAIVISNS